MSDLAAGLLLLSNMKTPVTSRRSARRPSSTRPPLVGRLHEMAITRPVPAPPAWWPARRRAGDEVIPNPQMRVLGRPGHGKGALAKRLVVDGFRNSARVVNTRDGYGVLLDEFVGCDPLDLARQVDRAIDPLTLDHARSSSPRVTAGEW